MFWIVACWYPKQMCLLAKPASIVLCSSCIVNNGVVYIAYQFEPDWDAEDISEEDHAEPVQAQL